MRNHLVRLALLVSLALFPLLPGCSGGGQAASGNGGAASAAGLPQEFNKEITALDGSKTTLAKYQGKVVLVNFWATWCAPCREEIPWLIDLNNQYASQGLVIVGVAMDDEGRKVVEPYVKTHPFTVNGKNETMNYEIVLGNQDIFSQFGGGVGLPTSVLYGRDGRKLMTKIGSLLVEPEKFTKALEAAL